MKFVVSSTTLLNHLLSVGKVISSKNTLPILDYFLFELKDGMLKITASDLESTLISSMAVDSAEEEGVVAIPARRITDSLKEFSDQPLTFSIDKTTWEVAISWKTGKLSISGITGMGYPALPELSTEKCTLSMNAENLLDGITKTIFATADDELRPVMNGINITFAPSEAIFVATDAHKLVKYKLKEVDCNSEASFILPKKPANLLKSILPKEDGNVSVEFDSKNVVFTLKNHTLVCRLIEGNYPNYNAVIPQGNPNKILIDRIELLNSIRRVSVCSNQASSLIKLSLTANQIMLSAQDLDFSVSAEETITCNYEGEYMEIGFKSTFLAEILSNIQSTEVSVELADSTRAGLFFPATADNENEELLMLLMPMMINA